MLPILRLHEHKRSSRDQFVTQCGALSAAELRTPFLIGRGSLWATLVHLFGADLIWIDALESRGMTALPGDDDVNDLDELRACWDETDHRWHAFLAQLGPERLSEPVHRRSSMLNREYTITVLDVLLHVCTHQAHTIAQGRNMLRSMGHGEQASNDLVFWAIDRPLPSVG